MKVIIEGLLVLMGPSLRSDKCVQAPNVPYGTVIVAITAGTTVSIQPTYTHSALPGKQCFQASAFAGSNSGTAGTAGYLNGIGTSALFNDPRDLAFERQT